MPRLHPGGALTRLRSARIARLATVGESGRPHLVPVTFALSPDDSLLVTAIDGKPKSTMNLRRLRNIAAQPLVSVLVDHYDEDWSQLWWVRADGTAIIRTGADRLAPISWLLAKYPQYHNNSPQGPVIAIELHDVTGWAYTE